MVQNNDQDALVFFYAPWCSHCQSFSRVFDQLGALFASSRDKLVVAKIDSIDNDIDDIMKGVVVESFPTLYFVSGARGAKEAVRYEGDRALAGLVEFINDKVGTAVVVPPEEAEAVGVEGAHSDEL